MVLDAVTTAENFIDVFIGVYLLAILLWVLPVVVSPAHIR